MHVTDSRKTTKGSNSCKEKNMHKKLEKPRHYIIESYYMVNNNTYNEWTIYTNNCEVKEEQKNIILFLISNIANENADIT